MTSTHTGGDGRAAEMGLVSPETDATDESGAAEVTDDDVFGVLSNPRRRRIVEYLRENGDEASVGTLAEVIAAEENDTTLQRLSSQQRKRVYVSLYQNHLPMMDDANVVDYEEHRKTVALLDGAERLEPYLTDDAEPERDRAPAVVALLLAAVTVLLGSLQFGAFAAVPVAHWGLLGVAGLVGAVCFTLYEAA